MPESAPHVTLLVNENFKAKDMGPMMKTALGVKWEQTENPLIFQSQDSTMIKILCSVSALADQSVQTAKQKEARKSESDLLKEIIFHVPNQV